MVLFINTILNLDENLIINEPTTYLYSLTSYAMPLLFMICAYQYAQSSCHIEHFQKTLLKYGKYLTITVILNVVLLEIDFNLADAVLINHEAVAYFGFIKTLLIFQLFILSLYIFNEGLLTLVSILFLLSSSKYAISSDLIIYFTYFLIGYYYKKSNFKLNRYLPWWLMTIAIFTPFAINFHYETVDVYVFISSFIIFNAIIKLKDINVALLKFYGYRSLESVFFQYFIIELFKRLNLNLNIYTIYIIIVVITTICVYCYTKLYKKIHKMYLKNKK